MDPLSSLNGLLFMEMDSNKRFKVNDLQKMYKSSYIRTNFYKLKPTYTVIVTSSNNVPIYQSLYCYISSYEVFSSKVYRINLLYKNKQSNPNFKQIEKEKARFIEGRYIKYSDKFKGSYSVMENDKNVIFVYYLYQYDLGAIETIAESLAYYFNNIYPSILRSKLSMLYYENNKKPFDKKSFISNFSINTLSLIDSQYKLYDITPLKVLTNKVKPLEKSIEIFDNIKTEDDVEFIDDEMVFNFMNQYIMNNSIDLDRIENYSIFYYYGQNLKIYNTCDNIILVYINKHVCIGIAWNYKKETLEQVIEDTLSSNAISEEELQKMLSIIGR